MAVKSRFEYEFEHSLHNFKRKPRKKLEKNKKQPPRHPGIIQKFVDLALEGKTFESRPEMLMQQIFAKIGVEPSAKEGLYGDTNKLHVSGDGTCVNSGGSSFGNKVCNCRENGQLQLRLQTQDSLTLMPVGAGIVTMASGFTVIQSTFFLFTTKI